MDFITRPRNFRFKAKVSGAAVVQVGQTTGFTGAAGIIKIGLQFSNAVAGLVQLTFEGRVFFRSPLWHP